MSKRKTQNPARSYSSWSLSDGRTDRVLFSISLSSAVPDRLVWLVVVSLYQW